MKAQIAAEFIMYTALAMIIVIATLFGLGSYFGNVKDEKAKQEIVQYGRGLQKELIVSSQVKQGYSRQLRIPETVLGNDYSISNDQYSFTLKYKDIERVFQTPKMSGSFTKGINTITYNGTEIKIQ